MTIVLKQATGQCTSFPSSCCNGSPLLISLPLASAGGGAGDEGTVVAVLLYLGFQGEFPVGVVEGKGFLSFQHLPQRSIDPQRLQIVGYLTARPGQ